MAQAYLSTSLVRAQARAPHSSRWVPSQQKQRSWRGFPLKWPLPVRAPSHQAFNMEIWLALTFLFLTGKTLRPRFFCFFVLGWHLTWSRINIRGIGEQSSTRDLAAEEHIWTKAMDIPQTFLLFLCVLHLTCKYSVFILHYYSCDMFSRSYSTDKYTD